MFFKSCKKYFKLSLCIIISIVSLTSCTARQSPRKGYIETIKDSLVSFLFIQSKYDDEINEALAYVDSILNLMGIEMPEVIVLPNSNDAFADGNTVYVGELLAAELSPIGLAQVIMHEVGHVHKGHSDTGLNELLTILQDSNLIPPIILQHILHEDEFSADVFSAIAAWILDPNPQFPEISSWLSNRNEPPSESHPDSQVRAEIIAVITQALHMVEEQSLISSSTSLIANLENQRVDQITEREFYNSECEEDRFLNPENENDSIGDDSEGSDRDDSDGGEDGSDGSDGSDGNDSGGGGDGGV